MTSGIRRKSRFHLIALVHKLYGTLTNPHEERQVVSPKAATFPLISPSEYPLGETTAIQRKEYDKEFPVLRDGFLQDTLLYALYCL